eukprot:TRINITY_DN6276_c0_g1_i1.p1 TRINITY_DN6276_c0_g1~~TRINITY_DN6276_c0_g1_i1.p1  ORF type:complete len:438 (+),score=52.27 TRINITY_DN6276_c0_g1_i1:49-1314(+)
MNLYGMSIKGFITTFVVFVVLFSGITLLGFLYGPYVLDSVVSEPVPMNVSGNSWTGIVNGLSSLNQQLILSAKFHNLYGNTSIEQKLSFNITFYAREHSDANDIFLFSEIKEHTVACDNGSDCKNVLLVDEPEVRYEYYRAIITVLDENNLGNCTFTFTFFDYNFTLFELYFRFFYLLITFIFVNIFCLQLRGYSWRNWTLEQKWMTLLLFGLLAFNNPLFPLEILIGGWVPLFIDSTCVVGFITLLLLYTMIVVDGIRYEPSERLFCSFYFPKFVFIFVLIVFSEGVFIYRAYNSVLDPALGYENDPVYQIFNFAMPVMMIAYLIWMTISTTSACAVIDKKPFLKRRLIFFLFITIFVIIIIIGGVVFNAFQYQNTGGFLTCTKITDRRFSCFPLVGEFVHIHISSCVFPFKEEPSGGIQ